MTSFKVPSFIRNFLVPLNTLVAAASLFVLPACLQQPKVMRAAGERVSFQHSVVVSIKCMDCHEVSRPELIIDTATKGVVLHGNGDDCKGCHLSSETWAKGFVPFAHKPLPPSCVICHQSVLPKEPVKGFDHAIAGSGDCVSCHANNVGVAWTGGVFGHSPIPQKCAVCHAINRPVDVVKGFSHDAGGMGDCVSCHKQPGVTFAGGIFSHSPAPASCNDCHAAKRPLGPVGSPAFDHVKGGSGDCVSCHKQPGVTWAGARYDHSPTPTSCKECHSGIRPVGLVGTPAFDHSKGGSGDCVSCHKNPGGVWAGGTFNHSPTPLSCNDCHLGKRPVGLAGTPAFDHAKAGTGDCVSCHKQPGVTWAGASYSHSPAPTSCIDCHLSRRPTAVVNGFNHSIDGTGDCAACHKNAGVNWAATVYNHSPVPATCANCHASKRPSALVNRFLHSIAGTADCKACHTKPGVAWTGGLYNHSPAPNQCSACHTADRPKVVVNAFNHATSGTGDCISCHTFVGVRWSGGTFSHSPVPQTCNDCHLSKRPVGLVGTPAFDHAIAGTGDCVNCHLKNIALNWTEGEYTHSNPVPTTCASCHSSKRPNVLINRFSHSVAGLGDCAGCHKKPGVDWLGAIYTHSPVPGDCQTCHSVDRPGVGVVYSGFDHSVSGKGDCKACHMAVTANLGKTWAGGKFSHTGVTACLTCHKTNSIFAGQSVVPNTTDGFNHKYVVINNDGGECYKCHKSNIGTSWAGGKYNHNPKPASGAATCLPCHSSKVSTTHHGRNNKPNGDCVYCHVTYGSWNN